MVFCYLCETLRKMDALPDKIPYVSPAVRWLDISLERHILSNTEPIGGKDDPDHDW